MAPGMKASTQTTKNMERAGLIGRMAATTTENLFLMRLKAKGNIIGAMGENTRETGSKIKCMDREPLSIPTEKSTSESIRKIKRTDLANLFG